MTILPEKERVSDVFQLSDSKIKVNMSKTISDKKEKVDSTSIPLFLRILERFFGWNGYIVAKYPMTVIVIMLLFTVFTAVKIPFTKIKDDFMIGYTPTYARSLKEIQIFKKFNDGEKIMLFIYITAKDGGSMTRLNQLNETIELMDHVSSKIKVKNDSFNDFCTNFCRANDPIVAYRDGLLYENELIKSGRQLNVDRFNLSYPIMTFLGQSIDLSPNFYGIQYWPDKSINRTTNIKDLKLIILLYRAIRPADWTDDDTYQWNKNIVDYCHQNNDSLSILPRIISFPYIQDEIQRTSFKLFPYLSIGFAIMCACSVITVFIGAYLSGQPKSISFVQILYAIAACICPMFASGTTLGFLFWCGFRFGSVLLVVPFLVLAIGVDDAFIMINAWERLVAKKKILYRSEVDDTKLQNWLAELLSDVGPSITITSVTNMVAFGIGAYSPTPEVRLFCIASSLSMVFDFLYSLTAFAGVLVIGTKLEKRLFTWKESDCIKANERSQQIRRFFKNYCNWLEKKFSIVLIAAIIIFYWGTSIYGISFMKAGFVPHKLFLSDSPLIEVYHLRSNYVFNSYTPITIFVNNVGNLTDTLRVSRIKSLVEELEALPECNGAKHTHFWIRAYERFIENMPIDEEDDGIYAPYSINSIMEFTSWPENRHWGGFMKINNKTKQIESFFIIIPYHGNQLSTWNGKLHILQKWRSIVDKYMDLSASVFDDYAQFTDQLTYLMPLTIQSCIYTFIAMSIVCFLFMMDFLSVFIASLSTFSIFIGVFGLLALNNIDLDPMSMTALILTIGLSVEFSAHLMYHYYRSSFENSFATPKDRIAHSLAVIGYPLLQCCIATALFILCLLFVKSHTSTIFTLSFCIVVTLGTMHAFVFVPSVLSLFSKRRVKSVNNN